MGLLQNSAAGRPVALQLQNIYVLRRSVASTFAALQKK
jgi:hypothetical protein